MRLPISIYKIRDSSMESNFREGDFVLANRWVWKFSVGDVVIAHNKKENFLIIKRIKRISAGKILLAGDSKESMKPFWVSLNDIKGKAIFHVKGPK